MPREFHGARARTNGDSRRDEKILELFAWVQEHTNLCRVLSCCDPGDKDSRDRILALIEESSRRGAALSESICGVVEGRTESEQGCIPVGASPRVLQPMNFPLISGSQRFLDRQGSGKLTFSGVTTQEPPKELLPSRDYTKSKSGRK